MPRFQPGQSGNPKGRPRGVRTWQSKTREALAKEIPALFEALIEKARSGDTAAAKLILDRCLPPLRPIDSTLKLPPGEGSRSDQGDRAIEAVLGGTIPTSQGLALLQMLNAQARLVESEDLVARMDDLEAFLERIAE